jgi:alpha-glucosidase (family GH31 glycosyl hydrolase)
VLLTNLTVSVGSGSADIQSSFGSFRFDNVTMDVVTATQATFRSAGFGPQIITLQDGDGIDLADLVLTIAPVGPTTALTIDITASNAGNRVVVAADCTQDDHFLGLGSHAQDVDHVGEAFPLFVSEPGVGKTFDDDIPDDWFIRGTRHASSYPVPFFVRPHVNHGLLFETNGRVEMDLCHSDSGRFSATIWDEDSANIVLFADTDPVRILQQHAAWVGRPELPPPWAFAPWNDAIRGVANVLDVAQTLRDAGAVSSVIWTEDWKGGRLTDNGYRVSGEWTVDRELYPDPEGIAQTLNDQGFRWFGYFAPYVREGTTAWDEALAADAVTVDAQGNVLTFTGPSFEIEAYLDLTSDAGQTFAIERMQAAADVGFDGWMADFAEWLPIDAVLDDGSTGLPAHNRYPGLWQSINAEALQGRDATFFARSGFGGAQRNAPIIWGGDQRTDFQADDGFPSVLSLGLGASVSGIPIFTHDVAGYNSIGNPPSTQELWFRWAWLGAFSPILRTHHGAFADDNHQFNSTPDTLDHWVRVTQEHTRIFPYRYGIAARASTQGIPMILPIGFRYDADVSRNDAWLLGDSLLVAPITEQGATSRQIDLPEDVQWFDWWTDEPVSSGVFNADAHQISVFAASGTTVPLLVRTPDSLDSGLPEGVSGLDDVDDEREVRIYGNGGIFTEADGTTYTPSGTATGSAQVTGRLSSGDLEVGGLTLTIEGSVERTYTVRVITN